MEEFTFESRSLEDTARLGRALGAVAQAGLVVGLRGGLGAGKTTFVRSVAEGLAVPDPRRVTSPTFILIQEYAGRLPIYHFDTYRLNNVGDFVDLGASEYFQGDGVCLVEWADRVEEVLPLSRLDLEFAVTSDVSRRIRCISRGEWWSTLLRQWQELVVGCEQRDG